MMRYPFRGPLVAVLVLFSMNVVTVFGAEWAPLDCPKIPLPLDHQYQETALIDDFAGGIERWSAPQGGQHAESAIAPARDTTATAGRAMRIAGSFSGEKDIEYVEVCPDHALPPNAEAIAIRYRVQNEKTPVRVRLRDASGEYHQLEVALDAGGAQAGGWRFGIVRVQPTSSHWGGDGNGRLDRPVTLHSILFDRVDRGKKAAMTAWLDRVALARAVRLEDSLEIAVQGKLLGNIYAPGDVVSLRASGDGQTIRYRAEDFFGRTVAEGKGPAEETTIRFPVSRLGYYACRIDLEQGGHPTQSKAFTCAVVDPDATGPQNRFVGMCCHFRRNAYPPEAMELLKTYGISEFRDEVSWSNVERDQGRYVLPEYGREFIDQAQQLHRNPLLIFDYSNPHYDEGGFPNSDAAVAAYARYCAFLTESLRGKVDTFEVWNEWSVGCGMRGAPGENTPAFYAKLLKAAYPAIKAVNPEATVVGLGGEHSAHHFENIRGMFEAGAARAMDAYSVHSYRYPRSPEESELYEEIRRVADLAAEYGAPARAWVTEIGWPTHRGQRGVDPHTQARYFVRCMAILQAAGVEKVHWYDFKDDGLDRTYNENNFGVVRHQTFNYAPKPAAAAARVFSQMTAAATDAKLQRDRDLWQVEYALPDDRALIIAWATGEPRKARVLGDDRSARGIMGNAIDTEGGVVTLSEDAVYITGKNLRFDPVRMTP